MRRAALILALVVLPAAAVTAQHAFPDSEPTYVPQRVYSSGAKVFTDFESMAADLATADVAVVGEQHDDPATHRLERAILDAVWRRGRRIVMSLEMFERDVQKTLDEYLAGRLAEFAFLRQSRPWPRYDSDYRPLVELAKLQGWPVVAANVPRRLAAAVAKDGLAALEALPPGDRVLAATEVSCPEDAYYRAFLKEMHGHVGTTTPPAGQDSGKPAPNDANPITDGSPRPKDEDRVIARRYFESQCVKDETMAEAIVQAHAAGGDPRAIVIHFTGSFHSDYRHGTVARVERRLPNARVRVVSIVPVSTLDTLKPDGDAARGDYIVYALKPARGRQHAFAMSQ